MGFDSYKELIDDVDNNEKFLLTVPTRKKFRKSTFHLVGLSLAVAGLDVCYSAELVYASPLILKYKVSDFAMSWMWAISPFLGFILTPLLGSLSDTCTLRMGRRRPFIILLTCVISAGALLVSQTANFFRLVFPSTINQTISGSDSIDLNGHYFSGNLHILLVFFTIIGVAMLDFGCDSCQAPCRAYIIEVCDPSDHTRAFSVLGVVVGISGSLGNLFGSFDYHSTRLGKLLGGQEETVFFIAFTLLVIFVAITVTRDKEVRWTGSVEGAPVITYKDYLLSILSMPSQLRILCCQLCSSWVAVTCFSLFFTDYVGQVVYKGSPTALPNTPLLIRYNSGVRFGAVCLMTMTATFAISSALLQKALTFAGCKRITTSLSFGMCIAYMLVIFLPYRPFAILMSTMTGMMLIVVMVTPFLLIAQYHENESHKVDFAHRGLGTDIAVAQSMLFFAQFTLSLFKGPIQHLLHGYAGISMILGAFSSFIAGIFAFFINYAEL